MRLLANTWIGRVEINSDADGLGGCSAEYDAVGASEKSVTTVDTLSSRPRVVLGDEGGGTLGASSVLF